MKNFHVLSVTETKAYKTFFLSHSFFSTKNLYPIKALDIVKVSTGHFMELIKNELKLNVFISSIFQIAICSKIRKYSAQKTCETTRTNTIIWNPIDVTYYCQVIQKSPIKGAQNK